MEKIVSARKRQGRFRSLKEYDTSFGSQLVDFVSAGLDFDFLQCTDPLKSSNDYLSMTTSTSLRKAYLDRLSEAPQILGSTGSRLLSGSSKAHSSLETRFAKHFDSPAALLFNSGWDANVSFFSTIPQANDWVLYDELVHASVHSGMRASRVDESRRVAFKHNDPEALRVVLQEIGRKGSSSENQPIIYLALESLYSMDGDFSPLPALLDVYDQLVPRSRQCVVLDEAHSTGVYGEQGKGIAQAIGEAASNGGRVGVRLMTFGKAVGCSGGEYHSIHQSTTSNC